MTKLPGRKKTAQAAQEAVAEEAVLLYGILYTCGTNNTDFVQHSYNGMDPYRTWEVVLLAVQPSRGVWVLAGVVQ